MKNNTIFFYLPAQRSWRSRTLVPAFEVLTTHPAESVWGKLWFTSHENYENHKWKYLVMKFRKLNNHQEFRILIFMHTYLYNSLSNKSATVFKSLTIKESPVTFPVWAAAMLYFFSDSASLDCKALYSSLRSFKRSSSLAFSGKK